MNKILINKDLLLTLEHAEKGFSLKENAGFVAKISLPPAVFCAGLCAVYGNNIGLELNDYLNLFSKYGLMVLADCGVLTLVSSLLKGYVKEKAEFELLNLTNKLALLNVNTTPDLLKKAKLVDKQYHFEKENNKLRLKENKYIDIKVCNGVGKEFEETLLQEHYVGSKQYEISVQSPQKKLEYKLEKHTV